MNIEKTLEGGRLTLKVDGRLDTNTSPLLEAEITLDGVSISSSTIPEQVEQATFDLAEALLTTPTLLSGGNSNLGELIPGIPNSSLQSASVDVISVQFRAGGAPTVLNCLTVVPSLVGTLGDLCLSVPKGNSGTIKVFRG